MDTGIKPPFASVTAALHPIPAPSSNSDGSKDPLKTRLAAAIPQNSAQVPSPGIRCHSSLAANSVTGANQMIIALGSICYTAWTIAQGPALFQNAETTWPLRGQPADAGVNGGAVVRARPLQRRLGPAGTAPLISPVRRSWPPLRPALHDLSVAPAFHGRPTPQVRRQPRFRGRQRDVECYRYGQSGPTCAVVIALAFVLGAAGYGIVRGLQDNAHDSWGCGGRAAIWINNHVTLPTHLPEGVRLATACHLTGDVTLWYGNEQKDKVFVIAMIEKSFNPGASVPMGAPIQLGTLTGYASDKTQPDSSTSYSVFFEKRGWIYGVAATLGKNGDVPDLPDNKVTPDELKAVALSMAER